MEILSFMIPLAASVLLFARQCRLEARARRREREEGIELLREFKAFNDRRGGGHFIICRRS